MSRALLGLGLLGVILTMSGWARADSTLLDDFEAADLSQAWSFSNGAEFPGATGSMTAVPGHPGQALSLQFDFSNGGAYVAATRDLATPVNAMALGFDAIIPPNASVGIRVRDQTGQWLQYSVERPLAPLGEGDWFHTIVELGATDSHFSGADDGVVHPPIDSISFTVSSAGEPKSGSVTIDQLSTFDSFSFAVDPATSPLVVPPAGVTNLRDGLGVAVHSTSDTEALDAAKSAGLTWVRTDLFWEWVESQKGVYDFSAFDGLLDLLDARGMRALFILCYGNPLYGGGPPTSSEASAAYAAYAKAAAQHFAGRNVRFEIWNEPDNAFWTPTDPVAYATVAEVAMQAVHEGDPNVEVSTGGISWFDFEFLGAELGAGAGTHADAIGIHPYRGTTAPETLPNHVIRARSMIAGAVSSNPPLWDTEWGYTTTQFGGGHDAETRKRQGVLAVRRMLSARLVGFPLAIWYDVRDDGTSPDEGEQNFGLIANDGSDKPAIVALRMLAEAAKTRELVGLVDVGQPALAGVRLDGADDTMLVLWAVTKESVTVAVPMPQSAQGFLGDSLTPSTRYTLEESEGPVYLVYPRAPDFDGGVGGSGNTSGGGGTSSGGSGQGGNASAPDPSDDDSGCGCQLPARDPMFGLIAALGAFVSLAIRRTLVRQSAHVRGRFTRR